MTIAVILGSWFVMSVVAGLLIGRVLHRARRQEDEVRDGAALRVRASRSGWERGISIGSARW